MKEHWHQRYLDLAKFVSGWSKDPSTQTGAVIVHPENYIVSVGYNGFPPGDPDRPEDYLNRELKYKKIIHCEMNAVLQAGRSVRGCYLYTYPFASCERCAVCMVKAGISKAFAPKLIKGTALYDRWAESLKLTESIFKDAGVELNYLV